MALGGGLSTALGVAGFTNLDVVRNPSLGAEPYLARFEFHQVIPLSQEWVQNDDRGPLSTLLRVPRHRLEVGVVKMSAADLFDVNPAASDSHMQFLNWTVDNNGAWDYPADTRGYTLGAVIEYKGPWLALRFGEFLMPKVANGIDYEFDLTSAHGEHVEVEARYLRRRGWTGTLRLLGYANHARMGSYEEAIAAYLGGLEPVPTIVAHRAPGRLKYGFGANVLQEVAGVARLFTRGGWNDGRTESFAYTEVDDTFEVGGDVAGRPWRRPSDKLGLAVVTNGLSEGHRRYLGLGGLGFLLGDGNLAYGRETIVEAYYNSQIWRGAFAAFDVQLIGHPGYNQDRGPVWVYSVRGHLEF